MLRLPIFYEILFFNLNEKLLDCEGLTVKEEGLCISA